MSSENSFLEEVQPVRDLAPMVNYSVEDLKPGERNWVTTLDRTNEAQKMILIRALQQADKDIDSIINQPVRITDFLAYDCPFSVAGSGEIVNGVRVVLILDNGETVGTASKGIFDSLRMLIGVLGMGPWHPGLGVVVRQITTRRGRRTYQLEYYSEVPSKQDKKGNK